MRISNVFLISLFVFFVISVDNVYAYLDPGTGSYLVQVLIASLLAGLFFAKTFWLKIKTLIADLLSKKTKVGSDLPSSKKQDE